MYMHGDTYVVLHQHATTTPTVDTVVRQVRLGKVTPCYLTWRSKVLWIFRLRSRSQAGYKVSLFHLKVLH